MACSYFDLDCKVYMVKVSYEQKPFRREVMKVYGASVTPSPSDTTEVGRRILAAENELSDESYWTTYADDFQDLILDYVEARLEEELRFLQSERAEEWTAFRTLCRISDEEAKDTERFLLKCDKVNYGLAQRVDDLWQRLCQIPMKEI